MKHNIITHMETRNSKGNSNTNLGFPKVDIGVTKGCVKNLDAHLHGLRRGHLYILHHQWLSCFPCHSSCKQNLDKLLDLFAMRKITFFFNFSQKNFKNKSVDAVLCLEKLAQLELHILM
jgi:hypothetical protein